MGADASSPVKPLRWLALMLALMLLPLPARASDEPAIVLVRFTMAKPPAVGTTKPHITFARFDERNDQFTVNTGERLQQFEVAGGHYYILKVESGHLNVVSKNRPRPGDKTQTIRVEAGTVTYVGDYHFDEAFALQIRHQSQSLLDAQADTSIPRLPLRVAGFGTEPLVLTWD